MELICLVGCSGVGKDAILKSCLSNIKELKPVISHTTRPMRSTEFEGREYHFIDIETATNMLNNDEFIEERKYYVGGEKTWLYGIHKNEIDLESDNKYISIVDLQGLKKIEKYLEKNNSRDSLISIYIDVDYQKRLQRSLSREGCMTNTQVLEVIRRFEDDKIFVEPAKDYCDLVLKNNTIDDFANTILRIKNMVG